MRACAAWRGNNQMSASFTHSLREQYWWCIADAMCVINAMKYSSLRSLTLIDCVMNPWLPAKTTNVTGKGLSSELYWCQNNPNFETNNGSFNRTNLLGSSRIVLFVFCFVCVFCCCFVCFIFVSLLLLLLLLFVCFVCVLFVCFVFCLLSWDILSLFSSSFSHCFL